MFFNNTGTTEIYTLSLHDALPISQPVGRPEPEIHPLDGSAVIVERLVTGNGVAAFSHVASPLRVGFHIPAPRHEGVTVCRRPQAYVRGARPIRRVVAGPVPRLAEVRDLVVLESRLSERMV